MYNEFEKFDICIKPSKKATSPKQEDVKESKEQKKKDETKETEHE